MAGFSNVHHIEIGVLDGPRTVDMFVQNYAFRLKAVRNTSYSSQWLLVANDAKLLITSVNPSITASDFAGDAYITDWMTAQPAGATRKNSVFNVAFEVKNVSAMAQRALDQNATLLKQPQTISDHDGSVKTCVLKSCLGDVVHTLVQPGSYSGAFLPGFEPVASTKCTTNGSSEESGMLYYDHVALATPMGGATSVINWYESIMGMKRFLINSEETVEDGLVLSSKSVGLRLRAMEWWKCAETGLLAPKAETNSSKVYMVITEGLPPLDGQTEDNQIESIIRLHGCPGVHHLALKTNDLKRSTQYLRAKGVNFAQPPPAAYYEKVGRLDDIDRVGEDADVLKKYGILIDTECDAIDDAGNLISDDAIKTERYLLQIFTAPLMSNDHFFMEFIQREGATGFGSGNIAALYRSVQPFLAGNKGGLVRSTSRNMEEIEGADEERAK